MTYLLHILFHSFSLDNNQKSGGQPLRGDVGAQRRTIGHVSVACGPIVPDDGLRGVDGIEDSVSLSVSYPPSGQSRREDDCSVWDGVTLSSGVDIMMTDEGTRRVGVPTLVSPSSPTPTYVGSLSQVIGNIEPVTRSEVVQCLVNGCTSSSNSISCNSNPLETESWVVAVSTMLEMITTSTSSSSRSSAGVFDVIQPAALREYYNRCSIEFSKGNSVDEARRDAEGFDIPVEVLDLEKAALDQCGSLENLIIQRQLRRAEEGFNLMRCETTFADSLELDRLRSLALNGASVPTSANFVNSPLPPKPRTLERRLGMCYLKHVFRLQAENKVILLRYEDVPEWLRALFHLIPPHWTVKPGSDAGRFLADSTNVGDGVCSVNTPTELDRAYELYGELHNPTFPQIINMLFDYIDRHSYSLEEVRYFKNDVKGAFNHWNFAPKDCLLFTMLIGGIFVINFVGLFGWQAAPAVWQVFARAFQETIQKRIHGVVSWYVDDSMGFSHYSHAHRDQAVVEEVVTSALGAKGLDPAKTHEPSTSGEVIGWYVCLVQGTFRPKDRAIRKLMYVFFSVDLSATYIGLEHAQRLASLAERYSLGVSSVRPFTAPLHHMCGKSRRLTSFAKMSILVWRIVAILLFVDCDCLSVPLSRLRITPATLLNPPVDFMLMSDAQASLGVSIRDGQGVLLLHTSYLLPFKKSKLYTSYQNAREYLGFLLGMLLLSRLCGKTRGVRISWTNDNTTALSWVRGLGVSEVCKGRFAQSASLLVTLLSLRLGFQLASTTYVKSADMGDHDRASRGLSVSWDEKLFVPTTGVTVLDDLFRLCDPILVDSNIEDHIVVMSSITTCIDTFLSAQV